MIKVADIIYMTHCQVTLYGRGRLGNDHFLGEVVIALREMEEVSSDQAPDFRDYVLGRRSAKEKVGHPQMPGRMPGVIFCRLSISVHQHPACFVTYHSTICG